MRHNHDQDDIGESDCHDNSKAGVEVFIAFAVLAVGQIKNGQDPARSEGKNDRKAYDPGPYTNRLFITVVAPKLAGWLFTFLER